MMGARSSSSGHRRMRILATVLAVLGSTVLCNPVFPDELPSFRQGMWKYHRTVDKKPLEVMECSSPTEDMKKQNATLEKIGCRFSPARKTGNTYTFTVDCSIKSPSGATTKSLTTSILTVESESAYKVEIDVVTDGHVTKELLVAKRVGDCKR